MGETIDMKAFKKEQKKRERKEWVDEKLNKSAKWVKENKETLAVVIPAVGIGMKGGAKIIKGVVKHNNLKMEQRLKEKFIYDRSLGKYLELKKPLSNNQMKTILERKENGEKLANVLQNMNLLK